MITKMLIEIFQAIIEDPSVRSLLGAFDLNTKSDVDLETLMDELELDAAQRVKFREAYKDYQQDPYGSYEKYKYKYEPKSSDPFDKFDSYYQKFDDQAKAHEEKYGKGTGNWSHQKYRYQSGKQSSGSSQNAGNYGSSGEEKKHYEALELKPGAGFDEIKIAYKTQMKKYHPDKFKDETQKKYAESLSMKINVAYDFFKKKHNKS